METKKGSILLTTKRGIPVVYRKPLTNNQPPPILEFVILSLEDDSEDKIKFVRLSNKSDITVYYSPNIDLAGFVDIDGEIYVSYYYKKETEVKRKLITFYDDRFQYLSKEQIDRYLVDDNRK